MPEASQALDLLARTMRKLRAAYDRAATRHGLTLARAQVLRVLLRHDGVTQAELAELLTMEAPSLKQQIDALVAEGFIERRPREDDLRKKSLHVTELGRASPIGRFLLEMREKLLDDVPEADLEAFIRVLKALNANAARLDER